MHGILLALSASMCWGVADFLGGLKARSVPVLRVLGLSQPAGLLLLTAATIAWGRPLPGGPHAVAAAVAGAFSIAALGLFYAASSRGSMVIVAPLASSTGAIIPVLAGLARGETLGTAAVAGIVLALVGTPAAAWQPGGQRRPHGLQAALLAVAAGTAVGLWFTLMDLASPGDPLGATEVMRLTATAIALVLFTGHRRRARRGREPASPPHPAPPPAAAGGDGPGRGPAAVAVLAPARLATRGPAGRLLSRGAGAWLAIAAIGVTDALAEVCYTSAATAGQLSVISPLSSLYPVVTVILAAAVLRERVHPVQGLGALCALAGAALLAL